MSKPQRNDAALPTDDDDFETPSSFLTLSVSSSKPNSKKQPRTSTTNLHRRSSKRPKSTVEEKEEEEPYCSLDDNAFSFDLIESVLDDRTCKKPPSVEDKLGVSGGYLCNSIESILINPTRLDQCCSGDDSDDGFESGGALDLLINLCDEQEKEQGPEPERQRFDYCSVQCPLCGLDITELDEESRLIHSNDCLDKGETTVVPDGVVEGEDECTRSPPHVFDVSPVTELLRSLGLEKYDEIFVRQEIDLETLQWLTEEDLINIGFTTLGPRKKIVHALSKLRNGVSNPGVETAGAGLTNSTGAEMKDIASNVIVHEAKKPSANKLITDFFPGASNDVIKINRSTLQVQQGVEKKLGPTDVHKHVARKPVKRGNMKDIPEWCRIPGTTFRVDAFKYLRGDCSHWFLTHFHLDHYQGLTRSFCHGKVYCSLITARLVSMKIGIPWDRLHVLPLNQKVNIDGVEVTCFDANHCPGSIIILFEPANGKAVLHTGDFRHCEKIASMNVLKACRVHTLILDTTYCNPQYNFPKQEAVIQFVIEAIQAESFNPKTLFLIGSYTIGKERVFLEIARVLCKKVYVTAAKFRILDCLGLSKEDMQWFTTNENESHIHVVPMWTLASFKRLKHLSSQYRDRFSLIVAFSPTGWTFGKEKKKSPGRRWQQGTIIRYEVPYSEHSSFTELREFVKFISPERIIPSVNNDGGESTNTMVALLTA